MAPKLYVVAAGAVIAHVVVLFQASPSRAAWGWQITVANDTFTCAEGSVGCPGMGADDFANCTADATSYDCTVQPAKAGDVCNVEKSTLVCSNDDSSKFEKGVPHSVACINMGMNDTVNNAVFVKDSTLHWDPEPSCSPSASTAAPEAEPEAEPTATTAAPEAEPEAEPTATTAAPEAEPEAEPTATTAAPEAEPEAEPTATTDAPVADGAAGFVAMFPCIIGSLTLTLF